MLIANDREVYKVDMDTIGGKVRKAQFVMDARNIIGLDIDFSTQTLYLSDVGNDHIASIPLGQLHIPGNKYVNNK